MASLAAKKTGGPGFSNGVELVRVMYDFAADTGAQASYDVFVADSDCVVKLKAAPVHTTFTGTGMTLSLGKAAAGTDFINAAAVGTLTAGAVKSSSAAVKLAADEKIDMTIGTANATAGKIEFILEVIKY